MENLQTYQSNYFTVNGDVTRYYVKKKLKTIDDVDMFKLAAVNFSECSNNGPYNYLILCHTFYADQQLKWQKFRLCFSLRLMKSIFYKVIIAKILMMIISKLFAKQEGI